MCWEVVQSQVLAGIIVKPDHLPLEVFTDNYVLAPAGDAEVIKRAEKIASLQQDIPLFVGTPIYNDINLSIVTGKRSSRYLVIISV